MDVGTKIKEILDWRGIKQTVLAKQIEIPYTTLNTYLNNPRKMPVLVLKKIAETLNISILVLLDEEAVPAELSDTVTITQDEAHIISQYRQMKPNQQKFIKALVDLSCDYLE